MKHDEIFDVIAENNIKVRYSKEKLDEGNFVGIYEELAPDNQTLSIRYVYADDENYYRLAEAMQIRASLASIKTFKWIKFFGITLIVSLISSLVTTICYLIFS